MYGIGVIRGNGEWVNSLFAFCMAFSRIEGVVLPKQAGSVDKAEKRALELAAEMSLELVDVELVKESAGRFLRFYIDKPEGVGVDDCETFHKAMLPFVEDVDYDYMEVSSPGVDRPLKKQKDFDKAVGSAVEVRLYRPEFGSKAFQGDLVGLIDGRVVISCPGLGEKAFEQKKVALVKPVFDFDEEILRSADEEDSDEPID